MHGRIKVKSTEEQLEAKRLERLKKLQIYQSATAKIFFKRSAGEYDLEALQVSGAVLSKNPDFFTLWNYRKEIFMQLALTRSPEELSNIYKSELSFLEECLASNPKSYGSWQHRCFVMQNMPNADWRREIELCNKFLLYDERNFHCWDYRRFVLKHADVTDEEELSFTSDKIAANFSNYSSWHHRSKLLPSLFPSSSQNTKLEESVLKTELELVQNAFFTDPNDQSAWFYHRWLLGRRDSPLQLLSVIKRHDKTVVTFSSPVQPQALECPTHRWYSPSSQIYSHTWIATAKLDSDVIIDVNYKNRPYSFPLTDLNTADNSSGKKLMHNKTMATDGVLIEQLESCLQLYELEPDNKWVILAIAHIRESLDPVKYKDDLIDCFTKLIHVDPYRKSYYDDMKSSIIFGDAIARLSGTSLNLSECGLTRLDRTQFLQSLTSLDLSSNQLTSLPGISDLQSLIYLNVADNKLKSCKDITNMLSLETVDLRNNMLSEESYVENMRTTCPSLKDIIK